jgi:lysophospholipase L1-like esterase
MEVTTAMKSKSRYVVFLLGLLLTSGAFAQNGFYLKDGDRVVFYGDSITEQRLYTTFTETYVLTRFPDRKIEFIHSGWSGDRVTGGGGGSIEIRINRDLIAFRPTVVTIMLGMNDGRYRAFDQELFNAFSAGYEKMVGMIKAALPNVRMTLIQPSPYDDVTRAPGFEGGYNAVLVRYSQYIKELAQRFALDVADLNTQVVAALVKAKAADEANAQKIVPDRIHPGAPGCLLMAGELLKAWSAPAVVSAVAIDAATGQVSKADNTTVSDLQTGASISWSQADKALPMPLDLKDPVSVLATRSSDFVESLNQQTLKITGLRASNYILKIDSQEIATLSREALAEGVNLAVMQTPMVRQAASVHALTLRHNNIRFLRWRQIQLPYENDPLVQKPVVLGALDALEIELVQQQRAAAQPKPHQFQLIPQ